MDRKKLKKILAGYVFVRKNIPELGDVLTSALKQIGEICGYLKQEYDKYNDLVIVKEGKSCEFKEFIKLECTPGLVPSYECSPAAEIVQPIAEKAAEILKLAWKLGCTWAKEEVKKLKIKTEGW